MERIGMLLPWIGVALIFAALARLLLRTVVRARPDEWLLVIREGQLSLAGVGAWALRSPMRSVVRFTSTLQRVRFTAEALSSEHLGVSIEGFILWTVEPDGDGPFRAFQSLGIHDLETERRQLESTKHLLGAAQHRAFQALLAAEAQRYAGTAPIERLMSEQDRVVADLTARLTALTADMGVRIVQLQLLRVRPTEPNVLAHLSAAQDALLRERAKKEELAAAARIERMQQELERQKVEHERELAGMKRAADREDGIERANDSADRKRVALAFELERTEKMARAKADAIEAVAIAEEKKSPAVREFQLSEALAEQVTRAVASLPIKDAHWTTIGDSPLGSVGRLVAELKESLTKH